MFKITKAKKTIGDFYADDPHEWTLLVKPQIQDVTLFVHFHKLWLVEEVAGVEGDEAKGIEPVQEVKRIPACEVFFGFVKEGKFVVENTKHFQERITELAERTFVRNLDKFLQEGYKKDWENYKNDEPVIPHYYENPKESKNLTSSLIQQVGNTKAGKLLKHIMLGKAQKVSSNP